MAAGSWRRPASRDPSSRRYRPGTLVLETDFETDDGAVRVIDFMPRRRGGAPQLVRIVEGLRGRVPMRMELTLRPDYGEVVPWIEREPDGLTALSGPDAFRLSTPRDLTVQDGTVVAEFPAIEGASERFVLAWHLSFESAPRVEDADSALARTQAWWTAWSGRCTYDGEYRDEVLTSLIALKAMTNEVTGALVAAPTTSLPEDLGGVRNWDYRYCWLRDSVLTINALIAGGYMEEALAFRDFVLRVATGDPATLQIMYGVGGERRLTEFEVPGLPGYEGSKPVRIGNAASEQFQLDVYGEVASVAYVAADHLGLPPTQGGRAGRRSPSTSRRCGRSPTPGSGRRAARAATSRIPRSWPGSCSTARSPSPSASGSKGRSSAGARSGTRSTSRSAARATTPNGGRSRSTTARASSTPAC